MVGLAGNRGLEAVSVSTWYMVESRSLVPVPNPSVVR